LPLSHKQEEIIYVSSTPNLDGQILPNVTATGDTLGGRS